MISPDYFSFRWSWYRPILNRMEQPSERCRVEVRQLPIRMIGQDAAEYIPYVVQPELQRSISTALHRLQDYTLRYMVRGEKISAHKLPTMDQKARQMVAHLRSQNPHLSRDLLHHWCADPDGAVALLAVCEGLWEQGWKQDQADAAPWVPAINVLLLKLIRAEIAALSSEHVELTSHVILNIIGGLYTWALQAFLKRYLEGAVEVRRVASYESMMLPATPMVFMQYQPDSSLLADDSRIVRAYGLEPEIVPRMRELRAKVGMRNEGGILQLLAKDQLGAHLQRRTWARLSLWKLAMDSEQGGWMRYVLNAKQLDQLLAGQTRPNDALLENLKNHADVPVAAWLLAQVQGGRAANAAGEPWLHDNITLMAFRVFDEDIKIEVARRQAERIWHERTSPQGASAAATRTPGMRQSTGLRSAASSQKQMDQGMEKAWLDGEFVLIQPDITRALHSGKKLSIRHGSLSVQWGSYLACMQTWHGSQSDHFFTATFLPGVLSLLGNREGLFIDSCSASGCLLRGPVVLLTEAGIALRDCLRQWLTDASAHPERQPDTAVRLPLSMCLDMGGEWSFAELSDVQRGVQRIAFSQAVAQADAGACQNSAVERLILARNNKLGLESFGSVGIETVKSADGQLAHLLHNGGFAMTAAAIFELTRALTGKAAIRELHLDKAKLKGMVNAYRMPTMPLELLQILRHSYEEAPWLLMKVGTANLAGADVELFEVMDAHNPAVRHLKEQGLIHA
ncbi:MAG: hypothetical protein COW18_13390 [Zetaproteobacteria bacterium CG12_big_fil_rev_8_21_14_0_65_54_13]|nr:MAG: hypothetical protein COX55_00950 [Zetaproteobacteria bacterium CG23_combo_of_CG06-09_8_20_14_all_54_7]PIW44267.1 MAG: hypothetical protein COW18_13390 [Zetaproteobacteria bacterium CG12_big_fil_rev_8_21_14_0_65_54_13]PIX54588.1 MAG: hypothetical protein COZ50_07220 [Zetaproteobacteria bacterium CG_4_10_14_3_um_filter_54_28]PJA27677.1 MAG: hypothetical protein CO188_11845 [Zetaproteobacteria bacterium CG_4_9_14_3_um_filter_54_145]